MANNISKKSKNLIQQLKDCFLSSESASIAFTSMFAIIPFFAVILFGSSYIASKFGFNQCESNLEDLTRWLFDVFNLKDVNDKILESAKNYINNFGIGDPRFFIGIIAFIWSITGVYYEIENFFNKIWEIKDNRTWSEKRFLNKKVWYWVGFFIIISIGIAMINIFIPLEYMKIAIFIEFFICCCLILFLAYKFIPKQQPKGKNAILSSFVISIFIIITLVISSFIISFFSYKEIYGSQLFFYLLIYQFIWTGILAGCRLTFELEMGFSDYMGEKRLNWKDLSYRQKEALCWHFYNNIEDKSIDPKIKIWALEKLKSLNIVSKDENNKYIKNDTTLSVEEFHNKFYKVGNDLHKEINQNNTYNKSFKKIEEIWNDKIATEIEKLRKELQSQFEKELNDKNQRINNLEKILKDKGLPINDTEKKSKSTLFSRILNFIFRREKK